jgi:hypothetical protein
MDPSGKLERTLEPQSRVPTRRDGESWPLIKIILSTVTNAVQQHIAPYSDFVWLAGPKEPLPRLLTLHNYGLLTLASQASAILPPRDLSISNSSITDDITAVTTTGWERVHQRAYLIFAVPSNPDNKSLSSAQVRVFLENLLRSKKVYVNVLTSDPAWDQKDRPCGRVNIRVRGTFPRERETHLSQIVGRH